MNEKKVEDIWKLSYAIYMWLCWW